MSCSLTPPRNVNFEPKFLENHRRYMFCLSLLCPHFSVDRYKNNTGAFRSVSCHLTCTYFGGYHYVFFFRIRSSLGSVLPFILMGTIRSLAVFLQRVYLKNECVLRETECVTSSLQGRAAGKSGDRILFSWIWISYLIFFFCN